MKNIMYKVASVIIIAIFIVFGLACLFLGTDLLRQGLTIEKINEAALDCHRGGLQSYVSARNHSGEPVTIKCRGFD